MPTQTRGRQIKDDDVGREDINVTTSGRALVTKVLAGTNIGISYTGADVGTGDVTVGLSGVVGVGNGGTGASTLTGVLIGNGTSAVTGVAGTAGQILRRNLANTGYEFFSIGNSISGTGAAGQVAFWDGTSSQTGDNGLFWDNTNKRLGVGASPGAFRLDVNGTARVQGSINLGSSLSTISYNLPLSIVLPAIGTKVAFLNVGINSVVKVELNGSENGLYQPIVLTIARNSTGASIIINKDNPFFHEHSNDVAFSSDTSTGNIFAEKILYTTARNFRVSKVEILFGTATVLDGSLTSTTGVGTDQSITRIGRALYITGANTVAQGNLTVSTGGITLTGAQSIQTSTGNLTLATAAGNGNILLTPNGTGRVELTGNNGLHFINSAQGALNSNIRQGNLFDISFWALGYRQNVGSGEHRWFTSTTTGVAGNAITEKQLMTLFPSTASLLIQDGGTHVNAGFRLDVNGTGRFTQTLRIDTINNGVGDFITTDGNGVLTRRTAAQTRTDVGAVGGSGTINKISKWSSSTGLTDSLISESASLVTIGGSLNVNTVANGTGNILTRTATGDVRERTPSQLLADIGGVAPMFIHTQSTTSTTWTITHNLNISYPIVNIYDSTNKVIIPQEIEVINSNSIVVTFYEPTAGYASIAGGVLALITETQSIANSLIFG
jgi:hypothetical protein